MLLIPSQKSGTPRLELNRRVLSPLCFGAGIGAYGLEFHKFFLMQDFLPNGTCNLVWSASSVFLLTQADLLTSPCLLLCYLPSAVSLRHGPRCSLLPLLCARALLKPLYITYRTRGWLYYVLLPKACKQYRGLRTCLQSKQQRHSTPSRYHP